VISLYRGYIFFVNSMDQKSGFSFPGILRYISSMPSQIAHFIFAQDLVSALSPSDQNRIQPEYLFLGAQGPDIFYHNLRTKPSGVFYGGLMHRPGLGSDDFGSAERWS
jgi:hypothetical protein